MKINENKIIPKSIKDFTSWQVSRRNFVKSSLAVGAFSYTSFLQSCAKGQNTDEILNEQQLKKVISIQNILFPKDDNTPGAIDFNAQKYLLWVLSDKRIAIEDKDYIRNGIKWINETAQENHSKRYLKLNKKEQVQLIQLIAKKKWGESWLSVMLTYIFEAMISDPIYGYNSNGIGWKWLEHNAGFPRPKQDTMYDEIFDNVK